MMLHQRPISSLLFALPSSDHFCPMTTVDVLPNPFPFPIEIVPLSELSALEHQRSLQYFGDGQRDEEAVVCKRRASVIASFP